MPTPPRCDRTRKLAYASEQLALEHLRRSDWSTARAVPIRAYRCPFCGWWHLTSQPQRTALKGADPMTHRDPTADLPLHLRLPQYRIDYAEGLFTSTSTGERAQTLTGVILAQREDRVLWPTNADPNRTPVCVNGSLYGPCYECAFARFSRDGTPPVCSEELTILLRESTGNIATVTARRSMVRALDQYVAQQVVLQQPLHSQVVELRLTEDAVRGGELYALRVMPGAFLEAPELARMGELATRVGQEFGAGGL